MLVEDVGATREGRGHLNMKVLQKCGSFWSVECYDGVEVVGLVMEWLEVVKSVGYVKVLIRYSFGLAVTRVKPYICTMPLRMDDGWNQIQFNLADFTRRAYGTNYVETLRVQVHANCRLRRIYFSDRLYSEEELPPEFKLYLPMQKA
nr:cilia- and flagella-associated protein 20-like [Malus domestica]